MGVSLEYPSWERSEAKSCCSEKLGPGHDGALIFFFFFFEMIWHRNVLQIVRTIKLVSVALFPQYFSMISPSSHRGKNQFQKG